MTVPTLTPCPGGFITAQPLPDGRTVVESWWLNPAPRDSAGPCSEPVHHWIAADETESTTTVTQFVTDMTRIYGQES
ncbi:hypothetical protein [Streptomyces prasinus]